MPETHQPLVDPKWLAEHLSDPNVVVLDVRIAPEGGQASWTLRWPRIDSRNEP